MIITFCGHSDFKETEEYKQKVLDFFERNIGNSSADIYLGEHGNFDNFAYTCCKTYKSTHSNISLIFVSPYLDIKPQRTDYDALIYPEIENKPLKFAITYRNKYMVEKADFVIAFVYRPFGGAYKTYKYAKSKQKTIFNLAEFNG